jgi:large repetitive protein
MKKLCFLALLSVWLALPVFGQQTTSGSYTVTVNPAPLVLTPSGGALSPMTVGSPYTTTLTVSGGTAPYSWALTSGTLPAGLKLTGNSATATIAGTPTAVCSPNPCSFVITVTDSSTVAQIKALKVGGVVAKN